MCFNACVSAYVCECARANTEGAPRPASAASRCGKQVQGTDTQAALKRNHALQKRRPSHSSRSRTHLCITNTAIAALRVLFMHGAGRRLPGRLQPLAPVAPGGVEVDDHDGVAVQGLGFRQQIGSQ